MGDRDVEVTFERFTWRILSQYVTPWELERLRQEIQTWDQWYDAWEKAGIYYGGLVELIVNAMVDAQPGFIDWEWH